MLSTPAGAEVVRIATFSPDLTRDGPGLLLRDILSDKDAQIAAVVAVIAEVRPDILLLTGIDWDHDLLALTALAERLAQTGADFPHRFAGPPNSGLATGLDLDGDGRLGTGDDAQGFGAFQGRKAMAVLSRLPLGEVRDFSATLWRDLPDNLMPPAPEKVAAVQRLSSTAHWDVPVRTGTTTLHLLAYSATPPVFGTGDRNARRNHDETAFWAGYDPGGPFVILGDTNLDPVDGEGRRDAWAAIAPLVQDPQPRSAGGAAAPQDGANAAHEGDPAQDTADWPDSDGPGNMRVDVVLPAKGLTVVGSGVFWPAPGEPLADTVAAASRHRLVWVDLDLP